jgi:hypothetical protein
MIGSLLARVFVMAPLFGMPLAGAHAATGAAHARVHIVHGYLASPQDHWFPWLEQQLRKEGARVSTLQMPRPDRPELNAWLEHLQREIGTPDQHTYFVAHSLGCVALMHYLATLPSNVRIGGVVLVSGFTDPLPNLPQLDEFTAALLDLAKLAQRINHRFVIVSTNDTIVPPAHTRRLSRGLDARLLSVENAGHFLASDGFVDLPVAHQALLRMLPQQP